MRKIALLDKTTIHITKDVVEIIAKNFDVAIYLPAYSPSFAPVEHFFSIIKHEFRRKNKGNPISLNSHAGLERVKEALQRVG